MPGSESFEQRPPFGAEQESGGKLESSRARLVNPAELLSRIWRQNLPILRDRVATLETAAQSALHGGLTPACRTEASDMAHKLAGSLGMFGYPEGTAIARRMEELLEAEGPVDAAELVRLAAQLRSALPL